MVSFQSFPFHCHKIPLQFKEVIRQEIIENEMFKVEMKMCIFDHIHQCHNFTKCVRFVAEIFHCATIAIQIH